MGQKINPIGFRVGVIRDYTSHWFSAKGYAQWVKEDHSIRKFILKTLPKKRAELANAGIACVEISRPMPNRVDVTIFSAKPGMVIGRQSKGIEDLRRALTLLLDPAFPHRASHAKDVRPLTDVRVHVEEIGNPDRYAQLVADNVAQQITRRVSFKRAMRQGIMRCNRAGVQGVKIRCAGRLGGSEMARTEVMKDGKIPLQTIRADVDYALSEAPTTYGHIGVKVWVYRGDVMPGERVKMVGTPASEKGRDGDRRERRGDRRPRNNNSGNRGGGAGGAGGARRGDQNTGRRRTGNVDA